MSRRKLAFRFIKGFAAGAILVHVGVRFVSAIA